jgi:magnesium chelatase subunit D
MSAGLAAAIFAVDPAGVGGLVYRGRAGPPREAFLDHVKKLLPPDMPLRRMPPSISDDRLLGGLDLGATLALGRPIAMRGLLADAHGGILIAPMCERMPASHVAHVVAAMDRGEFIAQREGLKIAAPARFGLLALDESEEDESVSASILDRTALLLDERKADLLDDLDTAPNAMAIARARQSLMHVESGAEHVTSLVETAAAFGIDSIRACLHALHVARICAVLAGREAIAKEDLMSAVRLVLAPRARQLPPLEDQSEPPPEENASEDNSPDEAPDETRNETPEDENTSTPQGEENLTDAVRAALPPDLLKALVAGTPPKRGSSGGKSGLVRRTLRRGRPIGSRPGELSGGARLALIDTLRAAAPQQVLRRRLLAPDAKAPPILMRKEDMRIKRMAERTRVATIFVVDASGSSALHRLAEAKGAVQLLLAECYVRRDEAALISFRGRGAELLLAPTRSLARVRKQLAQLPGGGGTPLASGIAMASELAESIARRGDTPILVFFTDGQANVTREGIGNRAQAEQDASAMAKILRARAIASLLVDTSPRPQPRARKLAEDLGARYLPLPAADAQRVSKALKAEISAR